MIFIPRRWKTEKLVLALLILEFPFTVANLTLFGIAAPNLYRTKLWQEGGQHGWNSDPMTVVLAAANYQPVPVPMVWSNFQTNFNVVVGVLTMFFYLVKCTMFIIHVFYPLLSLLLHLGLAGIWSYSLYIQTAPDTIDPARMNKGAPWYIMKSCSLSSTNQIKQYCLQAKSAFAVSVIMLSLMVFYLILTGWSLVPTEEQRIKHANRQAEKKAEKEKFSALEEEMTTEQQWQRAWELQQLPRTPGSATFRHNPMTPVTPRTQAFNSLGGSQDHYITEAPSPSMPEFQVPGKGKGAFR